MIGTPLEADRQRMKALLRRSCDTRDTAVFALKRQTAIADDLEERGRSFKLARDLQTEMSQVVETLRWQCAWIEQHLRQHSYMDLDAQPHPWSKSPPPDLLASICAEIEHITCAEPEADDASVTDRAVVAAIARAVGSE